MSLHLASGQDIICYESPRPTAGIHRVVFVLFQQLGRQTVYAPSWRQNFNIREFAELYNLGSPVAAVYFNCQREAGSGGRRMYAWPLYIQLIVCMCLNNQLSCYEAMEPIDVNVMWHLVQVEGKGWAWRIHMFFLLRPLCVRARA